MIEQQGVIVAVSGEIASVRFGGNSACTMCNAGKGCGAGVFGRLLQRKPVVLELFNRPDARLGQAVMVGLPEALFLHLVFSFYLFPLLAGLAGAALGYYISVKLQADTAVSDSLALLGAILAGSFALLWKGQKDGKLPLEFPVKNAVHLLRIAEQEIEGQCDSEKPVNNV